MQHLEEGTIHAWIDGALSAVEAREVEAHLGVCEACANMAAEARGLVAASSRILTALDDVPSGVIPTSTAAATRSADIDGVTPIARRTLRPWQTPFWIRTAAAVLVIAGTSALVFTGKLNNVRPSPSAAVADTSLADLAALSTEESAGVEAPPSAGAGTGAVVGNQAGQALQAPAAPPAPARQEGLAERESIRPTTAAQRQAKAEPQLVRSRSHIQNDSAALGDRLAVEQTMAARDLERRRSAADASAATRDTESQTAMARADAALDAASASQRAVARRPAMPAPASSAASPEKGTVAGKVPGAERLRVSIGGISPSAAGVSVPPIAALAPPIRAASSEHPAVGCYALSVSPWSGGEIPFGSPPARIELDSLTSLHEAIRGLNLVHPAPGAASNGAPLAYWGVLADTVYVTWRDEREGVILRLPYRGEVLRGNARTLSMTRNGAMQSATVEARRISCRP